jgi:hypothetical protein
MGMRAGVGTGEGEVLPGLSAKAPSVGVAAEVTGISTILVVGRLLEEENR